MNISANFMFSDAKWSNYRILIGFLYAFITFLKQTANYDPASQRLNLFCSHHAVYTVTGCQRILKLLQTDPFTTRTPLLARPPLHEIMMRKKKQPNGGGVEWAGVGGCCISPLSLSLFSRALPEPAERGEGNSTGRLGTNLLTCLRGWCMTVIAAPNHRRTN